ncbi:hypothetical protein ASPNIDRAFT_38025 [Aspergillus niger ATCC 1015]|uniref:Uncharacterized protein n=1 Tax=Aspergillus niger (strain ATCC 1015 / CBS 113.46 / FGSC A1144 / LSHB Ac4 / NCTC 3858a / NRRL 328 / USDA 3528.7) TaxID=380704 RepID=G3YF31_ASPNA|nr:hypothetical protein ASPNIDRAFT_38025 [Aspergillus niger ATCC 1015]
MSATVQTRVVDIDRLIPRVVKKDVKLLLPWVYNQVNVARGAHLFDWPDEDHEFRFLFEEFFTYQTALTHKAHSSIGPTTSKGEIVLPRMNWKVTGRESHRHLISSQGFILRILMQMVYRKLKRVMEQEQTQGLEIRSPNSMSSSKYVIGRQMYASRPVGQVTVGPRDNSLPIISYTGWFEEQTWEEFVGEVLSVMLGQLAKTLTVHKHSQGLQDQEVFVVGFHGPQIYIARGYFPPDEISRVHSKGISGNEFFELEFTRGYNPCERDDWLEAMRALTRLFRYLLSGNSKVGAMQVYLSKSATTAEGS